MEQRQLMVKMVLDRWYALLKNTDELLAVLSDEQIQQAVSPGKNRGIYLLGHLVAVHDDMIRLLDLGEKQYAALFELFVKSPDQADASYPAVQELRGLWKNQLETLAKLIGGVSTDGWFEKHSAVSAEDFEKEPHRNKLNIIITRSSHLAYHQGQLVLLK